MKSLVILLFVTLCFLSGCAQQYPPQLDFVYELPVVRKGNLYVIDGTIGEHKVNNKQYLAISADFPFYQSTSQGGFKVDIFSSKGDYPTVTVLNRFGLFKAKFELTLNRHQFVINKETKGESTYTTIVEKDGDSHFIMFFVTISIDDSGAWGNSMSFYTEYLPHYFPFQSWSPSVLEERREFISEFNERGKSAIKYKSF